MNVLVVHNFYQQPGGEDQCVAAEISMLRAFGNVVTQYFVHNDSIDRIGRIDLALRTIWSQHTVSELRRQIRSCRPEVVHFHNTFPLVSPAAYYAARAEGAGVVQTLHNFRLLCSNALLYRDGRVCEDCVGRAIPWPGMLHRCYRDSLAATATTVAMLSVHRAMRTWDKAVDVYIALTEFAQRKLVEGGLPAKKIAVKANFVYPDPGIGSGSGKYGVFVGRLSPEKGVGTLVEAWRGLAGHVPLKIIGDGPLAEQVQRAEAELPGIEWMGAQPLDRVLQAIGDAAFLVLPSQCYETFARVIAEAFAKGTPVIASRLGAMATMVEDGRTGLLFTPADADDLAEKVRRMLVDPAALAQMRRAARREFEAKFAAEANHARLMMIYGQAVDARGHRYRSPHSATGKRRTG